MPRLTAEQKSILSASQFRAAWFIRFELGATVFAFNSTNRDFLHESDNYLGRGYVATVSGVKEGVDLRPQTFDITLAGVDRAVLSEALRSEFINRPASIAIALIDDAGRVSTVFKVISCFIVDLNVSYGSTASIKLTLEDRLSLWSRPQTTRYTRARQAARNPDDKGFDFVEAIDGKDIIWPTAEWLEKG